MTRTPITPALSDFPEAFHPLLSSAQVYDSSCSPEASVYYIDQDGGFFLKTAAVGTLRQEAEMTAFFHSKGLGAEVLSYESIGKDWLLTRRIAGEDCTFPAYLEDPKRLCDTIASLLRQLHETSFSGCPVQNRNEIYLSSAQQNHCRGIFEADLFPPQWCPNDAHSAWKTVEAYGKYLKTDALLHGDYCLPNVMLDNWRFTGFLDLGKAGAGDRHFDIFWGVWTLFFNLKTNDYYHRFLDVYGRDKVVPELLRTVAALECFTE